MGVEPLRSHRGAGSPMATGTRSCPGGPASAATTARWRPSTATTPRPHKSRPRQGAVLVVHGAARWSRSQSAPLDAGFDVPVGRHVAHDPVLVLAEVAFVQRQRQRSRLVPVLHEASFSGLVDGGDGVPQRQHQSAAHADTQAIQLNPSASNTTAAAAPPAPLRERVGAPNGTRGGSATPTRGSAARACRRRCTRASAPGQGGR